jgi:hypothetical protein
MIFLQGMRIESSVNIAALLSIHPWWMVEHNVGSNHWRNKLRTCVKAIVNLGTWPSDFYEVNLGRIISAYKMGVEPMQPE